MPLCKDAMQIHEAFHILVGLFIGENFRIFRKYAIIHPLQNSQHFDGANVDVDAKAITDFAVIRSSEINFSIGPFEKSKFSESETKWTTQGNLSKPLLILPR